MRRKETREKLLKKLIQEKRRALQKAPPGHLRVSKSNGCAQYYYVQESGDPNGKYLHTKDRALATALAQKEYDRLVIRAAEKELRLLPHFNRYTELVKPEDVLKTMHPDKQILVDPIQLSDEAYIREWEAAEWQQKIRSDSLPEFTTEKGEKVRSKSEMMIANILLKLKIPYRYECRLTLADGSYLHPDFTLLRIRDRKELFHEHLGKMDDPGYAERNIRRLHRYADSDIFPGDQLLLTAETTEQPLTPGVVERLYRKYVLD